MEEKGQILAKEAETVFEDLLGSVIMDVVSEAHRAARLGFDPRLNIDEDGEYQLSVDARRFVGDSGTDGSKKSKHGVDVFGQAHPTVAKEIVQCMNCKRSIMAGRFAPHLEKCMGKGRRTRTGNANSDARKNTWTRQKATVEMSTRADSAQRLDGGTFPDMVESDKGEAFKKLCKSSRRQP